MTKIELNQIKNYLQRDHSEPEFKAFWDEEKDDSYYVGDEARDI